MVVPLTALSSAEEDVVTRSFFMQSGVTRWRDEHGFQRSDVRLGFVHRYALFEEPDDGVFGTSMFVQENLERGHTRVVTGLEYLDRWGQGSLSYYAPVTEWRPGRYGYRERALAGVELGYGTDLTNTINLSAGAGRWESKDRHGRVGRSGASRRRLAAASVVRAAWRLGRDRLGERFHGDARVGVDAARGRLVVRAVGRSRPA